MKKSTNHSLKHLNHKIYVDTTPVETRSPGLIHPGRIRCIECNKHLRWLSARDIQIYKEHKLLVKTYDNFLKLIQSFHNSPGEGNAIYLTIGYKEKHIAKENDAKWDGLEKLWYTHPNNPKAINLINYMLPDDIRWLKNYRYIHFIK